MLSYRSAELKPARPWRAAISKRLQVFTPTKTRCNKFLPRTLQIVRAHRVCAGRVRTTRGATLRDSSSTKSCSASRSRRDRVALVALAALVLRRDSADPPPSPTSAYGHLASVCCLCGVRAVGGTRPRVPVRPASVLAFGLRCWTAGSSFERLRYPRTTPLRDARAQHTPELGRREHRPVVCAAVRSSRSRRKPLNSSHAQNRSAPPVQEGPQSRG